MASVPVPICTRAPVPPMPAVLKFVPCVTVSVRLKASVLLFVIELPAATSPEVKPQPICSVPPEIVVAPA